MFEVVENLLIQFIDIIPYILGIYIIFDLTGSLLFGRK